MSNTRIQKSEDEMSSRIIGIQFGLLSPEEIRRNSVVEVTSRDTYNNDKPIIGGLFDPRMGTLEPGYICPTDGLNYIYTPGYFGHIELARPVYFIQHLKEIMEISRCVCYKCSHLLIDKEANKHFLQYPPAKRWKHVFNKCKSIKRCGGDNLDGCGTKQPTKFKQEGMATLMAIWESIDNEKVTVNMTAEEVLQRFKRISDEDVEFMGFSPIWSRPDWMISTVLSVPPPAMRPSVKHDAQQRREDDLTHIYSNIIKINNDLKAKIRDNAPANVIEQHTTILQYYVAMIVDNKAKGSLPLQQRSGRPLQCIMSRINSKTGRIRGNLMGKRVNFSARSVITGDPNLSIQEIGVPLRIAKNLTKPEIVNVRNRSFLMRLITNGPDTYPGAKTLERRNGILIALRNIERGTIQLYDGDIVHRHLMDGDCLLFNRQPSLHRMSMMAHIVRVMYVGDTFRFNVACTKPYNADFDGDEMNTHIPQNILAETELRHIANIPNQIISPAKNSPIIGIFQDSLLGSYRFTRQGVDFGAKEAMNLLMRFPYLDIAQFHQLLNKGRVTNFQLLSQILPPLSLKNKTKLYGEGDDEKTSNHVMEIHNGEYIRGQLEGSMLAGTSKGLIHRIFNDFGPLRASQFIDNLQSIVTEYMKTSCFSVGINDLIADANTLTSIKTIIERQKIKVQELIHEVQLGVFENNTSNTNMTEFESRVRNLLNESTGETGKISRDSLDPNNRFIQIITCGSKGTPLNLSYMISCIGQQNVEGKRVPYGFDGRTLPHYSKYDDSPNARGFIENSYVSGLTAEEVFFHAMAGRIGLIDTAVKSVIWDTPIIIIENGRPKYTEIGRWVDAHLYKAENKDRIQHFEARRMELLEIPDGTVFIPTTDAAGVVSWGAVTALTRHDPGTELYEIRTRGGRTVTVTESKSLLVWDEEKQGFHEKPTPEIKIGDFVPVTAELCEPPIIISKIPDTEIPLNEETCALFGKCFGKKEYPNFILLDENTKTKLKQWLGDFTAIPPDLFLASKECIIAFVTAYYHLCGGCNFDNTEYWFNTNSLKMVNKLSMLMNRLNISGEIIIDTPSSTYSLNFKDESAYRFKYLKNNNNGIIVLGTIILNRKSKYKTHNHVFLDPITEIRVIGVEDHPKVYDLTIPSTLNFGLANGLQVRDTSQTGYIQRRLIKGLEDLKVEYDMTVRNNKGKIIQFQYGDDCFETTRVENQTLKLVEMSIQDIYMHYDLLGISEETKSVKGLKDIYTENALVQFKKQKKQVKERMKKMVESMIEIRDRIVHSVFKDAYDNVVHLPVAFQYTINNIQGQMNHNTKSTTDLTPLDVMTILDEYFEKIRAFHFIPVTELFKTMYYFFLSPKDLLENRRFNRNGLTVLMELILLKYKQAFVHPGEMVGVIAGQSIGEPTTQLSQIGSTKIIISGKEQYNGDVKTFIDKLLQDNPDKVGDLGNNSVVMDLPEGDDYNIIGVSDKEKTSWNRILQISRHPANGNLVKVTTKTGKTTTATLSHSFLKRSENSIVPVKGSDLNVGDRIPIAKFIPEIANPITEMKIGEDMVLLDKTFGKFIGSYLADGNISLNKISISKDAKEVIEETKSMAMQFNRKVGVYSRTVDSISIPSQNIHYTKEGGYGSVSTSFNHAGLSQFIKEEFKTGSLEKLIPAWVFSSNKEFIYGLLSGYFNGDGNVNDILGKEIIRCHSISERLITDICLLLSYAGIFASKGIESIKRQNPLHALYICKKYAQIFKDLIGFSTDAKAIALDNVIDHNNRDDKHSDKEEYDKIPELGNLIAYMGEKLVLPGQSRNYGRWKKKDSIGRKTLVNYIKIFEEENTNKLSVGKYKKRINNKFHEFIWTQEDHDDIASKIAILHQAAYSDIIWDEIVHLEIIADNGEYVYDFTVPGNDSFMVDCGILVHNTLNTFHQAGSAKANATQGVPRIEEILRLTKNPKNPSITIFLKDEDRFNKDKTLHYSKIIKHTKLIDVVDRVEILFEPSDTQSIRTDDQPFIDQFYEFEKILMESAELQEPYNYKNINNRSKWILRLEINNAIMLDNNITMNDIHYAICNSNIGHQSIHCIYSDFNADQLVFRIMINNDILSKKKQKSLDQSDDIQLLKYFQETLLNSIVLRGVKGIRNVLPRELLAQSVREDGRFEKKNIWVLDTTGTNLLDTLALDFIDKTKTFSNDIAEIHDILGIEATRQSIYNEIREVMSSGGETYINYHHLGLLADRMTSNKNLVPMFRTGILADDVGPIMKATFEIQTDVFLNAAKHGELDNMRGVSANVMTGQTGFYGTHAFNLLLDFNKMKELSSSQSKIQTIEEDDDDDEPNKITELYRQQDDCIGLTELIHPISQTSNPILPTACQSDNYDLGF